MGHPFLGSSGLLSESPKQENNTSIIIIIDMEPPKYDHMPSEYVGFGGGIRTRIRSRNEGKRE
jgi:hypothetical protein